MTPLFIGEAITAPRSNAPAKAAFAVGASTLIAGGLGALFGGKKAAAVAAVAGATVAGYIAVDMMGPQ